MSHHHESITCELLINDRNEVCLITSARLPTEPQWAEFDAKMQTIYLVYSTGETFHLDFRIDKTLLQSLAAAKKLLVICLENNKPSEGYEINLITVNS